MQEGKYIVVLNRNTLLRVSDSKDGAVMAAEDHSHSAPRGRYEIFKLAAPVKFGVMGDQIKWE